MKAWPLDEKIAVSILGGTGLVGRALAGHLLNHPMFKLGLVVGSTSTAGKQFKDVFVAKEAALAKHYGSALWTPAPFPDGLKNVVIVSADDLVASSPEKHIVVSAIAPQLGHIEDSLQAAGFKVFSISPHARTLKTNPLVVPEANAEVMLETLQARVAGAPFPLIKSPNCVTCGISVVLKAIDNAFGIDSVAVTTFQALSGRGDAKYEPSLVVGNVYPLTGTTEKTDDYQRAELQRIFPKLKRCSVSAHRVPVQVGHFVDLKINTRTRPLDAEAVNNAMETFNPLTDFDLPSRPEQTIVVCREPGRPRPKEDCWHENGMAVAAGNVRTPRDGFFDITLSVALNNVTRGAYGAALINAELYELYYASKLKVDEPKEAADGAVPDLADASAKGGESAEFRCRACSCRVAAAVGWCSNCGSDEVVQIEPEFRCWKCSCTVQADSQYCSNCGSDDVFCFN
eukprot:m.443852 g.443852  ORF g.443852 m.443852 type:complete len:456 (+) comp19019_c0_seq1:298-1665(+)